MKARFALFALAATVLAGCGGSHNPFTETQNPYAGTYESTIALDSGKQGALGLAVDNAGTASGTLTVTAGGAAPGTRGSFGFTVGTTSVSGSVNHDGTFAMHGTDPNAGGFDITGSLPTSGNGTGSVTVSAGGNTYTGTITITQGNGSGSITFSNVDDANINSSAFPSNPYVLISTVNGASAIVVVPSATDTSRAIRIALNPDVTAGETIAVTGATGRVFIDYSENGSTRQHWIGTGGSIHVVSRTASSLELELQDVAFTPAASDDPGTGTFVINGTIQK